jgi:hypothetical protein
LDRKQIKSEILSFVAIGSINPQIFHPMWLQSEGLISESNAEEIENVNSPGLTVLKSSWFNLEATNQVLKVMANQTAYYEVVRDLVLGIFQVLGSTPIRVFGINNSVNIQTEKVSQLSTAGKDFYNHKLWDSLLIKPTFNSIVMQGEKRTEKYNGYQRITVQPSPDLIGGIFVDVNDHFALNEDDKFEVISIDKKTGIKYVRGEYISSLLAEEFTVSQNRNQETLRRVIDLL